MTDDYTGHGCNAYDPCGMGRRWSLTVHRPMQTHMPRHMHVRLQAWTRQDNIIDAMLRHVRLRARKDEVTRARRPQSYRRGRPSNTHWRRGSEPAAFTHGRRRDEHRAEGLRD